MQNAPAVIISSGKYYCHAGWSINSLPSVDFVAVEDELRSIEDAVQPGGWALCSSASLSGASNVSMPDPDAFCAKDSLWYRGTESFLSSTAYPVMLLDAELISENDQRKAAEFFFETRKATASLSALQNMQFTSVSAASAKERRADDLPPIAFPSHLSFSGIVLTSGTMQRFVNDGYCILAVDFEMTRLQPYFSGLAAANLSCHCPVGERLPKAVLYAGVHLSRGQLNPQTPQPKPTHAVTCNGLDGPKNLATEPDSSASCVSAHRYLRRPRSRHICCWRLARLLYDQCCFVSFDADMDSWLVQKSLAANTRAAAQGNGALLRDSTSNDKTQMNSGGATPLQQVASLLPVWNKCLEATEPVDASVEKTTVHSTGEQLEGNSNFANQAASLKSSCPACCLCSGVQNSSTLAPQRQRPLQFPLLDNCFGASWSTPYSRDWKRLLSASPSLERSIRETLREQIFLAPEVLFQPRAILTSLYEKKNVVSACESDDWHSCCRRWAPSGLADATLRTLDKSPIDLRREMYSNIVVLGNLAVLPYFAHRLVLELQAGIYSRLKTFAVSSRSAAESLAKLAVKAWIPARPIEARYAAWIGAKFCAQHIREPRRCVLSLSREEYEEWG